MPDGDFAAFLWRISERYEWLPPEMLLRLARAYGTRIEAVIGSAGSLGELGAHMGGNLYEAELRYLFDAEYARTAQDVLWRRSKLGLHLLVGAQQAVADWFVAQTS